MGVQAVSFLVSDLGAERALVLYRQGLESGEEPLILAAHGIETKNFWLQAPVSSSLLKTVLADGEPLLLGDVEQDGELSARLSVIVSGIRSVLCVPFKGKGEKAAGLLYADSLVCTHAFGPTQLESACDFARKLERDLGGPARPRVAPEQPPKTEQVQPPKRKPEFSFRPTARGRVTFFRCLATMVGAGVYLPTALALLEEQSEDPDISEICGVLGSKIRAGSSLTAAARRMPGALSAFELQLLRVGENTGRLVAVLGLLAEQSERRHAQNLRLRQAVQYPLVIFALALVALVLGPPVMLQPQFELLQQLGSQPPALTQALMAFAGLVASPWTWVVLIPLLLLASRFVFMQLQRLSVRRILYRVPYLGQVLRAFVCQRFAQALSLQLQAGILLTEALPTAAQATGEPLLEARTGDCLKKLLSGGGVASSLQELDFLPPLMLHLCAAGEEAGKLPAFLSWLSRFLELECETALERFRATLEPLAMVLIGLIVAVMLLATSLPMVRAISSL